MNKQESQLTGTEVAVIGMAGRFPGADRCTEFWENLKNGVESIWFFSPEELEEQEIEKDLAENPGYIKARGVIAEVECFDALFFGYTSREALFMDPQIRIFHEIVWEALEDAGYDSQAYEGLIGLYAGASTGFYWQVQMALAGNTGWGISHLSDKDFLSTRISYKLNLKGPCTVIQTACSTSLSAIHQAYRALLTGECDMALAGGVSLQVEQKRGSLYQEGMILSPGGHCRAFDARSNGVIDGSGVGIVLLKRLKKAIKDGDHIYALVKGSAINNDGERKIGFTAPSIGGQAEVIRTAQRLARVEPETVTYIETHGTGTDLGDPVEIEALKLAFNTGKKGFCRIGSVKTNLGHLDAAAGVAGFIKTVLALKHGLIPPSLHYETPNPKIDFENSPFVVNCQLTPWESNQGPRRAGVSSFGIGGANAHVILEETPEGTRELATSPIEPTSRQYQLILLSAKTETALDKMTGNLVEHFKQEPDISLADAAYTLQVGRKPLEHRKAVVCTTLAEAVEILSAPGTDKVQTSVVKQENPRLVFIFPGQGAQYVNMGRGLYDTEPLFRREMDHCFEILSSQGHDHIKEILYPNEKENNQKFYGGSRGAVFQKSPPGRRRQEINQTGITQPVIFVFEYALAKLLTYWGITAYAMIGHSIGEYVAACISGVLSLQDAIKLVVHRGRLMEQIPPGAMVSVSLAEAEVQPLLKAHPGLALAAVNSTSLCTVSGPTEAVQAFFTQMQAKGIQTRRLHTSHAFHSSMMDPVLEQFEAEVKHISWQSPKIPYISNVTGDWLTPGQAADPGYWSNHLRSTVRFADGIEKILEEENLIFVEMGPGQVLSTFVRKHDRKKPSQRVVNLVRHPGEAVADERFLMEKIGQLWLYGQRIQWNEFHDHGEQKRNRVSLPTYPFESKPYRLKTPMFFAPAVEQRKSNIADWFYIPQWKRSLHPHLALGNHALQSSLAPGPRLVFMDDCGMGTRLMQLAKNPETPDKEREVIVVRKGETFSAVSEREYTINPADPHHYQALVEEVQAAHGLPGQVVHLWGITGKQTRAGTGNELTAAVLAGAVEICFYSLVYLARAIGTLKTEPDRIIPIEVITDRMQEIIGGDGQCPEKAVVLGPIKVIPREYPNIRCRSIDIILPELDHPGDTDTDPGGPEDAGDRQVTRVMRQLAGELAKGPGPGVMALRGNYRWVQVFEPVRLDKLQDLPRQLKPGGVYLITGGLGGIGLVLARHLVKTLQAKLALINRTVLPEPDQWQTWLDSHDQDDRTSIRIQGLRALKQLGGEVLLLKADAANPGEMETAIARVKKEYGQINGVIHAAGVPDGGMIQQRTRESTEPVLAPKLTGVLVLEALLKSEKLDFFMICSSLSSILSPFGQVAYSSANAFLDAYANYRGNRNHGPWENTRICSINWGAWKEVGMAVEAVKQLSGDPGTELKDDISPVEGVEAFDRILSSGLPQVAVSTRNLLFMIRQYNSFKGRETQPLMPKIRAEREPDRDIPLHQRPDLSSKYIEPEDQLEKILAGIFQDYLGLEKVGIDDNFFELGTSSLDLIQLNAQLKERLNKEVPIVIMFTYSTVRKLARYLREEDEPAQSTASASIGEEKGQEAPRAGTSTAPEDLLQHAVDLLKES